MLTSDTSARIDGEGTPRPPDGAGLPSSSDGAGTPPPPDGVGVPPSPPGGGKRQRLMKQGAEGYTITSGTTPNKLNVTFSTNVTTIEIPPRERIYLPATDSGGRQKRETR